MCFCTYSCLSREREYTKWCSFLLIMYVGMRGLSSQVRMSLQTCRQQSYNADVLWRHQSPTQSQEALKRHTSRMSASPSTQFFIHSLFKNIQKYFSMNVFGVCIPAVTLPLLNKLQLRLSTVTHLYSPKCLLPWKQAAATQVWSAQWSCSPPPLSVVLFMSLSVFLQPTALLILNSVFSLISSHTKSSLFFTFLARFPFILSCHSPPLPPPISFGCFSFTLTFLPLPQFLHDSPVTVHLIAALLSFHHLSCPPCFLLSSIHFCLPVP